MFSQTNQGGKREEPNTLLEVAFRSRTGIAPLDLDTGAPHLRVRANPIVAPMTEDPS